MKKLSLILAVLVMVSCQSEPGPVGPEGPQGPAGPVGQAFEVEASFSESNNYTQFFEIPSSIEVLESDIVAVYLLWEVDEDTGNDVWQPLPVSVFFDDGELQYAFDHTFVDVRLFLTGDTNLGTIGDSYTQNQIFRVAVLPVDYVEANKINMSNMGQVMNAVDKSKIKRIKLAE